jgi:type II secretory ATPase GspE/PulE/Tfp pilus assembly ATPase PilB-like protein
MQIKKMHKSTIAAEAAAVNKAVDAMLERAIARQATDIHIEPRDRNIVVRFRVDGWLHEIAKLPLGTLSALVANIKKRALLDVTKTRTPQSGVFGYEPTGEVEVVMGIATMPTITGEKLVIHLTPRATKPATLESLGYWGPALRRIEETIAEPHGLIIANSPNKTASSLSLLGIVHLLSGPALSIATLEDPIERHVNGINQTQVNAAAGVSFATGLQGLLKQDPNVLMISDVHEHDTVALVMRAALSGHLILGGLHTNSAAHGVAHLLHMHTEPFTVAAALKLSLGQRFVRRLCAACREPYNPDESVVKGLETMLRSCGVNSMSHLHELEKHAAAEGIGSGETTPLGTSETGIVTLWRARKDGCPHCHFTGFSGRVGLCEVLTNTEDMKKLIAGKASMPDLQAQAVADGMMPMQLDGLIKSLRGLATVESIL